MAIQNQEQLQTLTRMPVENNQVSDSNNSNEERKTATDIQNWLVSYLAQTLDIRPHEISTTSSWKRYGLDSATTICLASDLEDWLGQSIDPTITHYYPTLETLANHLASGESFSPSCFTCCGSQFNNSEMACNPCSPI